MSDIKNSLNSTSQPFLSSEKQSLLTGEAELAVRTFANLLNERSSFLSDQFVGKVKDGSRKALLELQRYSVLPTRMDLRNEFSKCLRANIPDEYRFELNGKFISMLELKTRVPEWAMSGFLNGQ
jgi:hypothetical protein